MVNKKYDEALFDAALEQAFAEAFKRDIAKIEEENKDMPEHPKKYVDMERAYYKKKTKPKTSGMLVFRKVAACVMAVLSVGFITVLAVPDVRASVWDSAVGWFEKYVAFSFEEKEEPIKIGEFLVNYVPDQFELVDSNINTFVNDFVFSNGVDDFYITVYNQKETQVEYDYENCDVEYITINNDNAYIIYYNNNDVSIIWYYNNCTFVIEGNNISIKTMQKIAENIS